MREASVIADEHVDGRLYIDPDVYEAELERIWRRRWLCVGHESELEGPGSFRSMTVVGEPLLMVRGDDDVVRVLYNRCLHRGNLVCQQGEGTVRRFHCAYHGWTYSPEGRLVGLPSPDGYEDNGEQFRAEGLAEVATAHYAGFVFVRLGDGVEPLVDQLGPGAELLDRLVAVSPTGSISLRAGWSRQLLGANWKIVFENQIDGYHVPHTHRSLLVEGKRPRGEAVDYGSRSLVRSVSLGRGHSEIDFRPSYRAAGATFGWFGNAREEALGRYADDLRAHLGDAAADDVMIDGPPHAMVFPNLFVAELNVYLFFPVSPGCTAAMMTPVLLDDYPEFNRRAVHRANGALGSAGLFLADDAEVGERNQAGLRASQPRWVDTGRGLHREEIEGERREGNMEDDVASRGFWREYAEVMKGVV